MFTSIFVGSKCYLSLTPLINEMSISFFALGLAPDQQLPLFSPKLHRLNGSLQSCKSASLY